MNKNIEIQKIKVNNGQELIQKAKEYKNSGGEWKLREKYFTGPGKGNIKEREYEWGIIIGNGLQEIDIKSVNNNWTKGKELNNEDCEGSKFLINTLDMDEAWGDLCQIFPEVAPARQSGKENRGLSLKKIQKDEKEYFLGRYLVAENTWHLKQILYKYVRENENKIYHSSNPHFSGWVEIIDGQDGNMYLYVGEKNDNDGREIKIGIKKEEFYSKTEHNFYAKSGGGYYSTEEMLELAWNLFTIGRPRTPDETYEYYSKNGGLEEEWQRNWPNRRGLCRKYLEELRERMNQKFNYWQEKVKQKNYQDDEANAQGILAKSHISEIDAYLDDMKKNRPDYYAACDKDCTICGAKLCCHFEGRACSGDKSWARADGNLCHFYGRVPEPERSKNNQISDSEKSQILQYFIAKGIKKITLDNGKLVIEYNNTAKITEENKDQQLQKYRQIIQSLPNKSLSLSELQASNSCPSYPVTTDKNKNLYTGLVVGIIGGVILAGIIALLLSRKKKKVN